MRKAQRYIEPMFYSAVEVAQLLGFGRSSVYELIRDGEIPSKQIAGRIRVSRKSLLAWIETQPNLKRRHIG
jgi:excisionase family DNA binding protein